MNRPLQRIFPTVGIITKWRVDWQRSSRSDGSIVDQAMNDTVDLPRSVTKNSRTDSLYITDNQKSKQFGLKKSHRMEGLIRLTLF